MNRPSAYIRIMLYMFVFIILLKDKSFIADSDQFKYVCSAFLLVYIMSILFFNFICSI